MAARPARPPPPREDPLAAFHPAVGAWFRDALGAPTPVQARAWPRIAAGETTLLLAPTGSGKTLAAFLATLDRLARSPDPSPRERLRVLYVSPLKALAVDIERNLRAPLAGISEAAGLLGHRLRRIEAAVRTGDTPAAERARMLRAPPDVLITTPESLYLMLTSQQRALLTSVDTVIVDEIHQMAASKRGAHLFLSLERLEALRGGLGVQRIGLSATQKPLDEIARLLGGFDTHGKSFRQRPVAIVDASAKKVLSITVEVPPPVAAPLPQAPTKAPVLELEDGALELEGFEEIVSSIAEEAAEGKSVWPSVHARLVERIRQARSTMIFVNSRRLSERLATALNEAAGEELALSHHGSVAKEARSAIEERLKAGTLPAIVATSSLELGIDMGAVDQVIQVEAPPSVASGIQRIGRASHHVGGVPSGVLVPKHKHDLLACAAASAGIEAGEVEETYYPRNPLDVLAQQIVAIAAVGIAPPRDARSAVAKRARQPKRSAAETEGSLSPEVSVEELFRLVRRAAPFAELPRASFDGVLDMLAGRYPSDEFADLRARITWDRVKGTVRARAGAQRLAILNGGTIPDRGLYGVFLKDGSGGEADASRGSSKGKPSRRVGELDEEMVFELREGEVFLLGASSWRAEEITRDRVLVTPAAGQPGKMPFWHGDRAGRAIAFGRRIGALTRQVASKTPRDAKVLLQKAHHLDTRAADDLVAYIHEQRQTTGAVPSDEVIVVERVPDELGDLRICVLSPFGSRVHAPWSMAVLRRLKEARAGDIEAVWSDDGMIFRVPGGEAPPPLELLFPTPEEIEEAVTRELGTSSMFAARFREAAARALLLPRAMIGKRTPLWAQRKRSADLLSVASQFPSFPIILETYREVLRDVFDLPSLVELLRAVEQRKLRVVDVDTRTPSPFAGSLLFSFVGNFIYDEDAPAAERRAQALTIDHAQLRELLGETELRKLLDPEVIAEHEAQLQRRDRPFRNADALHDLLLWLGDLSEAEIASRAETPTDARAHLASLVKERRVVLVRLAGEKRAVAVEDVARYRDAFGVVLERGLPQAFLAPTKDALSTLVARHARTHGPFTAEEVGARFGIGVASAEAALAVLVDKGKVASGAFRPLAPGIAMRGRAGAPIEYCDVEVLRVLKRKTLARLRKAIEPVSSAAFARFLLAWQGVTSLAAPRPPDGEEERARSREHPEDALLRAIQMLEGCPVPASVLERHVLPSRVPGYQPYLLDQLLATGEVVWAGIEPIGSSDGRIALYLADREPLLARTVEEGAADGASLHARIRAHLAGRGAVFFPEIARTLGVFPNDVLAALWDLVWSGEVTNDTFEAMRSFVRRDKEKDENGRRSRRVRSPRLGPAGSEGRWSLRRARWGTSPTATERSAATARTLLERYGVVLREAAAAEGIPSGFGAVYDVLRAMEDQGRVRRGYFVAGRGATQFALPGAEERLRAKPLGGAEGPDLEEPADADPVVLAATDPANPYGALVPWPETQGRSAQRSPGARVVLWDGALVGWLARGGQHLVTFLPKEEPEATRAGTALARAILALAARGKRTWVLATIDGVTAAESPVAARLAAHGFATRQGSLALSPPRDALEDSYAFRRERARERAGA